MNGPGDLHALAVVFKDAMVEALDSVHTADPTLLPAPERAYVSPGLPVFDCPTQLAVYANPVLELQTFPIGLAEAKRIRVGHITHVRILGVATRCLKTGDEFNAPTVVELEEDARQIHADGWALWNHMWSLIHEEQIVEGCQGAVFEGMTQLTPSGGSGGWELRIRVELDGYNTTFGT